MPVEATPLFRPDILRPLVRAFELPESAVEWQATLRRWAELLASPAGQGMKETELLPDFLSDVFRRILGYTAPASAGERYTLSRETLVEVDGQFVDAVLGNFHPGAGAPTYLVAVEGKGPTDPLERPHAGRKMSAVDQAYRYAINLPCDWIVVTNLRQIRLYHKGSTQRTYERWELAELAANEAELCRFLFVLGAERVVPAQGRSHLYELLAASAAAGEALTQQFYAEYAGIRRELLAALLADNPGVPPEEVLSATQKLLDRILFIAFCEDRGLLPPETLARAYEHADPYNPRPIWENFRGLFRAIDKGSDRLQVPAYNGGLFREDPVLDHLTVRDEVTAFFRRLGAYDYSTAADAADDEEAGHAIDVEILGHIFEQSIADLESLEVELREGGGEGVAGTSKRKLTGAYYTPAFVTRYIVGEALRPVLWERFEALRRVRQAEATGTAPRALDDPAVYDVDALNTPQREALIRFWEGWLQELQTVRVVDPACGSGAFLIEAFDQLYAEYQTAVGHLDELERGQVRVFDPDRSILQHNLYGVDLNAEAIQIARLSIWIKTARRGKMLTDLDHNIRPGNSIVVDAAVDARAFDWRETFPEVFAHGGFDVVLGNPPYIRAEQFTALKPYLQAHYETYHGAADLYVYFYELGLKLLRPGGYLSYIVTNKWLKAAYGEPLRRYYAAHARVEQVIDFGHAPIFPDADVFPCILVLRKPSADRVRQDRAETRACIFPREELGTVDIPEYVAERGYDVPASRFGAGPWSLENPGVEALLEKIRRAGVPLAEFAGTKPYRGIMTGFNEAFLIDTATRNRLVEEDPGSFEIIKPYLRGQDVDRWAPDWAGLWMIVMRSSSDARWPWSGLAPEVAEDLFASTYPGLHRHFKCYEDRLRKRTDRGEHWWELRSCSYYDEFTRPKITYQEIQFHPAYGLDSAGRMANNKTFFLPSADTYVLAVLNSPLMWWHNWRYLPHMKDDALNPAGFRMESLPIAPPTAALRSAVEERVEVLIDAATARQRATLDLHDWLRVEFGVESPGQRLSAPRALDAESFVAEVKKRKAGSSSLTSAELKRLRDEYAATVRPLAEQAAEASRLESELSALVNEAYGLTPAEVALLWETAPPRMPLAPRANG